MHLGPRRSEWRIESENFAGYGRVVSDALALAGRPRGDGVYDYLAALSHPTPWVERQTGSAISPTLETNFVCDAVEIHVAALAQLGGSCGVQHFSEVGEWAGRADVLMEGLLRAAAELSQSQ